MAKHFRKVPASDLHYLPASPMHPANTYFHFSFANYHNPNNMNFGVLRVLNDDDVKPHDGFGQHPHRDMEIVSYVVKGKLTHWDNATQAKETLGRGNVQVVTAGTGVWHSELNNHDGWTRFLQIWILPPQHNLPVRYENHSYQPDERNNQLLHVVGTLSNKDTVPLHLNQDVNIYVSELTDTNAAVTFHLKEGRQAYINNIEGSVTVDEGTRLDERDSLEVIGPAELVFTLAGETAHFILIEMAER